MRRFRFRFGRRDVRFGKERRGRLGLSRRAFRRFRRRGVLREFARVALDDLDAIRGYRTVSNAKGRQNAHAGNDRVREPVWYLIVENAVRTVDKRHFRNVYLTFRVVRFPRGKGRVKEGMAGTCHLSIAVPFFKKLESEHERRSCSRS